MSHARILIRGLPGHIVCKWLISFRVIVESKNSTGKADVAIAALNLIDLAGSESADVHGPSASSARSKEMKYINRVKSK